MERMNQLLYEWEKNCKELFQLSPQPMWVYDVNTLCFLDVNEAAIIHYGYSREEFLNMTIKDIRPQEDLFILEEATRIVREEKQKHTKRIYRHRKRDGMLIDVQIQSNILEFGDTLAELILVTDITAILQSEREIRASKEELLKSERRFKSLVQEGSDLISIVDMHGNYLFLSESIAVNLGYGADNMVGRNAAEFVHPDDKDRVFDAINSLSEHKRVSIQPFRFRADNGEWRWLVTTATNLLDDPAIEGIVTNSIDVTWAKIREDELRLSNARYRLVLKAGDEAVCDWDIVNDVVVWGSGIRDIFGYEYGENNNTIWSDNIHPDDKHWVEKELADAVNDPQRDILYSEYRFLKANREVAVIQYRALFMRDREGKAIRAVGSFRDITMNKETLFQVQKQNQQLKEIAWAQSHQVRGPLARIMALTKLLESEGFANAGQRELLTYLSTSADELDEMIRGIIKKAEALEPDSDRPVQ